MNCQDCFKQNIKKKATHGYKSSMKKIYCAEHQKQNMSNLEPISLTIHQFAPRTNPAQASKMLQINEPKKVM